MLKIITFSIIVLLSSCSNLRKGTWGKNALWPIKAQKIKEAFLNNFLNAHVLGPTIAAGMIYGLDYDDKMTKWIQEERLAYTERTESDNYSDNLNNFLKYQMYLSIFLPPSYEQSTSSYLWNKTKGGFVVIGSEAVTIRSQRWLRKRTNRLRPDLKDHNSLPSGHATQAGSRRVLISKNMNASPLKMTTKTGMNVINTLASMGTMVARVEGKRHYLTDVLTGYAFGSFMSGFIYDSLINYDPNTAVTLGPVKGGIIGNVTYSF